MDLNFNKKGERDPKSPSPIRAFRAMEAEGPFQIPVP
jgi:hypothetical protein